VALSSNSLNIQCRLYGVVALSEQGVMICSDLLLFILCLCLCDHLQHASSVFL